jgi:cytochrome c oxidase subunit II
MSDSGEGPQPRHGVRIALIWAVLSVIVTPVVVLVWGPHLPPGNFSAQAHDQTEANVVMAGMVTPILIFVWVYFAYALIVFRRTKGDEDDGPPIRGNGRIQATWIAVTAAIVLFLAVWGSFVLLGPDAGAGGGQGPVPLVAPAGARLTVQVIGQEWTWTYRYPSYGGAETTELVIPENEVIEFDVTSIDVVHSFWAYRLGVKADAVPGTDNIAYVRPQQLGSFEVRCSELCGLWHGQMYGSGKVVSGSDFATWIAQQQAANVQIKRYLPPYSKVYYPDPQYRAG